MFRGNKKSTHFVTKKRNISLLSQVVMPKRGNFFHIYVAKLSNFALINILSQRL